MTGAPLPEGADAVVPVEDTDFAPGPGSRPAVSPLLPRCSILPGRPGPATYIRPRGQDVRQGQVLLTKGRKLQPQDVGMLAAIGQAQRAGLPPAARGAVLLR